MNKADITNIVAHKLEVDKKVAEVVIDGFLNEVKDAVKNGEKVSLHGFGNFEARERAARKGRNPQTGDSIDIAASKAPAFKPVKAFKELING